MPVSRALYEAERDRADSLAAQVVALRETISDWLADYSPSSEAMYRAKAVLADTAAVAAEWKRQERLAGAREGVVEYALHGHRRPVEDWLHDYEASQEGQAS